MALFVLFENEIYNVVEMKESNSQLLNDVFSNLKLKKRIALEDLIEIKTESKPIAFISKLELIGSG